MLLFQKRFHDGLREGRVTLTFRTWAKPHVKPGGRYRCHPIGVLEVDSVKQVRVGTIRERDARRAGFDSLEAMLEYVRSASGEALGPEASVWRVELHYGGDGDRVEQALDDRLSAADVEQIGGKLARLDGKKPWTDRTLALIAEHPRVAASKLAAKLGRETAPFKADVVKLKKLGLTQSFEVGYEISPRGRAFLGALERASPLSRATAAGAKSRSRRQRTTRQQ
jgi:hypothetical protein